MLRALRGLDPDPSADQNLLELVGVTGIGHGPGFASFDSSKWSLLYGNRCVLYRPRQPLVELYVVSRDPLERQIWRTRTRSWRAICSLDCLRFRMSVGRSWKARDRDTPAM